MRSFCRHTKYKKIDNVWEPLGFRLDPEDYTLLASHCWWVNKGGYMAGYKIGNSQKKLYLHRVLMNAPKGMNVDHINGNRLDNRKSNLRLCTAKNNSQAVHFTKNPHGYKGVSKVKNRFRGKIKTDGIQYHLGYFDTAEEAAIAYNIKAVELFADFAVLNEVSK